MNGFLYSFPFWNILKIVLKTFLAVLISIQNAKMYQFLPTDLFEKLELISPYKKNVKYTN